jgi:hypothetical protein
MSCTQGFNMAKTKGSKGGNPNPVKTQEFLAQQYKRQGNIQGKLALKTLTVRVPIEIDEAVRSLPNRTEWLRNAIIAAAQKDGLC